MNDQVKWNQVSGFKAKAAHPAMQAPWAAEHATTAAGAPTPSVMVPKN